MCVCVCVKLKSADDENVNHFDKTILLPLDL